MEGRRPSSYHLKPGSISPKGFIKITSSDWGINRKILVLCFVVSANIQTTQQQLSMWISFKSACFDYMRCSCLCRKRACFPLKRSNESLLWKTYCRPEAWTFQLGLVTRPQVHLFVSHFHWVLVESVKTVEKFSLGSELAQLSIFITCCLPLQPHDFRQCNISSLQRERSSSFTIVWGAVEDCG